MFSFAGWQMICKCYDELKNPKVDMPIIITCKYLKLPARLKVHVPVLSLNCSRIYVLLDSKGCLFGIVSI